MSYFLDFVYCHWNWNWFSGITTMCFFVSLDWNISICRFFCLLSIDAFLRQWSQQSVLIYGPTVNCLRTSPQSLFMEIPRFVCSFRFVPFGVVIWMQSHCNFLFDLQNHSVWNVQRGRMKERRNCSQFHFISNMKLLRLIETYSKIE